MLIYCVQLKIDQVSSTVHLQVIKIIHLQFELTLQRDISIKSSVFFLFFVFFG